MSLNNPSSTSTLMADAELPSSMGTASPVPVDHPPYLDELLAAGLLVSTGVDGLYGRNATFESVVEGISALIGAWGEKRPDEVELLRFPPAMSRKTLEESGYWRNCPDQIGTVFTFCGDDRQHQRLLKCLDNQDDYSENLEPARIVMTPVACYPVYKAMAERGKLPAQGRTLDIFSYCFRHEPSVAPERMQLFRQREFVRMGTAEQVLAFRDELIDYGKEMMAALQLPYELTVANDPFFGRTGKIMIDSQRAQQLKFELQVPLINPAKPTACGSFNFHLDKFGKLWNIRTADDEVAVTGCCGFGLERLALSLFRQHGFKTETWPKSVRAALWK